MKTLMIIISMFALMTMNIFGQTKTINNLLEIKESRQEVFNAIQNDHQLMSEFMQNMHGNQHALMMWNNAQMNGNNSNDQAQGQYMMNRTQMLSLMHNNPQMMQALMNNMVNVSATDTVMSQHLVNQMMQHPQMMYMMNHHGNMGSYGHGMMMNQNHHGQMNSNN
ncbi:hypothetical protein ACE1ET_09140 [Saccharicrinis sp. FJH62]|uniref:hypothetical protein n=1 Tax=Saccharicrinis sp. FJH62 TaxID=3344657 RepID=UPI0035D4A82E